MPRLVFATLFAFAMGLNAQQAGTPPQAAPATQSAPASTRRPPRPAAEAAPGGGPDKVWVNLSSGKYHCPGDRYYGKTGSGRYMTEAAAKSAGGKGPGGKSCFAGK